MSLLETINADLKGAMKEKNEQVLSTLRMLKAALKNKEIEIRNELKEEDVVAVIKTQAKQLKDSLEKFTEAGREELIEKANQELEILKKYMPEQMSDQDLATVVKEAISEIGATTMAEMGKVMGAVMGKVAGRADGTRVKQAVETELKK